MLLQELDHVRLPASAICVLDGRVQRIRRVRVPVLSEEIGGFDVSCDAEVVPVLGEIVCQVSSCGLI